MLFVFFCFVQGILRKQLRFSNHFVLHVREEANWFSSYLHNMYLSFLRFCLFVEAGSMHVRGWPQGPTHAKHKFFPGLVCCCCFNLFLRFKDITKGTKWTFSSYWSNCFFFLILFQPPPSPITSLFFCFALSDKENHIEKVITYQGWERGGSLKEKESKQKDAEDEEEEKTIWKWGHNPIDMNLWGARGAERTALSECTDAGGHRGVNLAPWEIHCWWCDTKFWLPHLTVKM